MIVEYKTLRNPELNTTVYKKFKEDMARQAFTQDIDYELAQEGTSLGIEVLKATNMDITYKVIRDYKKND